MNEIIRKGIWTPERRQCFLMSSCQGGRSGAFFINFEQITHLVLGFSLLTLSRFTLIPVRYILIFAFVPILFCVHLFCIFTVTKMSSFHRFFNALTANYEYSRNNTDDLPLPVQMQLSGKLKTFSQIFYCIFGIYIKF